MNPTTLLKAQTLLTDFKKILGKRNAVAQVLVAPPVPFLASVHAAAQKAGVAVAAQDVSVEEKGAHTGEVAISMLKSLEVSAVIVGHSERRAMGETDAAIAQKAERVLRAGLVVVLCVGEKTRDAHGNYFSVVEKQVRESLALVPASALRRLVVAYEPVWAIGTQKHAKPEDVQEMKLFIQKVLADRFGRNALGKVRILYGGSVTPENAAELLQEGNADGFLVGGASLVPKSFAQIVHIADTYGNA